MRLSFCVAFVPQVHQVNLCPCSPSPTTLRVSCRAHGSSQKIRVAENPPSGGFNLFFCLSLSQTLCLFGGYNVLMGVVHLENIF